MANRKLSNQNAASKKSVKAKSAKTSKEKSQHKKTEAIAVKTSKIKVVGRWLLSLLFKLTLIMIFVLLVYGIYLDSKIQNKFEGQRWQVPIQVYGKIVQYQRGQRISLKALAQSLTANRYLRVTQVVQTGEFAMSSQRAIIYRRAFDFGEGIDEKQKITIDVVNGKISQLRVNEREVKQVRLEPVLLDRILPKSKEDRVLVSLQSVPEQLLDTLLLVEDRNFYFHHGVSPLGILRALWQNIKAGKTVQGGSTLTQQLVKNMFLTREKTLWRKVNEAFIALILEYRYSKDQLLEAYINEVYLGQHYANGIYGFGLAAEFYFGKDIQSLTIAQMAMLIAQIKGPSYYDPWRFPERALARRDIVLRLMYQHQVIEQKSYQQAINAPLSIRKNRRVSQYKFPAYIQLVKAELSQLLPNQAQQSGIRVFTGFDITQQLNLQKSVDKQMSSFVKNNGESLQVAMVVTDIKSGEVRALVGDKQSGYAGFNRALHAKRPIGSLIKPVVYLSALEHYDRYNLATILDDKRVTLSNEEGQQWQPKNYDGKFRGKVSLLSALAQSINIPTVNLGMDIGLTNIADMLHILGYRQDIVTRPSMLLGAVNMSPIEVNQLYMPIANQGYYIQSHAIEKVINASGETLWQFEEEPIAIISKQAWYLLDYALHKVTTEGTARSLSWRLKNAKLAGKTGTTNEQRDSWFVGYDNKHLVTTWLGNDDNKPTLLTGSSGALVLFADFMQNNGVVNRKSSVPARVKYVYFDKNTGTALKTNCPESVKLPAVHETLTYSKSCLNSSQDKQKKEKNWFQRLFGGE